MAAAYSRPNDLAALRDYVVGPGTGMQQQADSTVLLQVTHSNLKTQFIEIRLDMHMSVENVKVKLSTHCGTSPSNMVLQLRDEKGTPFAVLAEDKRPLGYYSPYSGCNLHIVDTDPTSLSADGWLEDTSKVQKYVMSDDDYNGRENTYRKWKESRLREDPSWSLEKEMCLRAGREWTGGQAAARPADDSFGEAEAAALQVGQRCSVDPGDRRGVIRYVGKVEGLPAGWWVGVQYDEPVGKNDGSLKGQRFFQCPQNFGGFVRPDKLRAGDFPPHDDLDGLGSDDEI